MSQRQIDGIYLTLAQIAYSTKIAQSALFGFDDDFQHRTQHGTQPRLSPMLCSVLERNLELCQQLVQPINEADRIIELFADAEQGLVKENVGPVGEAFFVSDVFQFGDNRMLWVDLQNGLVFGQGLPC